MESLLRALRCLDQRPAKIRSHGSDSVLFDWAFAGDGVHEQLVRLWVYASAVKYDWLTALMLARAGEKQLDYGGAGTISPEVRYRARGLALAFLASWAAQARTPAPQLGSPETPSGR